MATSFARKGTRQRIGEWRILVVEAGVNPYESDDSL
jgi:hypothetical protein